MKRDNKKIFLLTIFSIQCFVPGSFMLFTPSCIWAMQSATWGAWLRDKASDYARTGKDYAYAGSTAVWNGACERGKALCNRCATKRNMVAAGVGLAGNEIAKRVLNRPLPTRVIGKMGKSGTGTIALGTGAACFVLTKTAWSRYTTLWNIDRALKDRSKIWNWELELYPTACHVLQSGKIIALNLARAVSEEGSVITIVDEYGQHIVDRNAIGSVDILRTIWREKAELQEFKRKLEPFVTHLGWADRLGGKFGTEKDMDRIYGELLISRDHPELWSLMQVRELNDRVTQSCRTRLAHWLVGQPNHGYAASLYWRVCKLIDRLNALEGIVRNTDLHSVNGSQNPVRNALLVLHRDIQERLRHMDNLISQDGLDCVLTEQYNRARADEVKIRLQSLLEAVNTARLSINSAHSAQGSWPIAIRITYDTCNACFEVIIKEMNRILQNLNAERPNQFTLGEAQKLLISLGEMINGLLN